MKILFLGDVVGISGCSKLMNNLMNEIKSKNIDFVIVNGVNYLNCVPAIRISVKRISFYGTACFIHISSCRTNNINTSSVSGH